MVEDYGASAFRHEQDARFLFNDKRYENAAYLAGYTVECSLKLLLACRAAIDGKALAHELSNLAGTALKVAVVLSPGLQRYGLDGIATIDFALAYWSPEMRYKAVGGIAEQEADQMCNAARICLREIVIPLILDGVVELPQ